MRIALMILFGMLFGGCSPPLQVGDQQLPARLAVADLQAGQTIRTRVYRSLGPPATVSFLHQMRWSGVSHAPVLPAGTSEVWSYFALSVSGMEPFSRQGTGTRRVLVRVYFDRAGVVTGWETLASRN